MTPEIRKPTHMASAQLLQPWADESVNYSNDLRISQDGKELSDDLRYILDPSDVMGEDYPSETFRVLKNGEMRAYGKYRTQRLVLEACGQLATAPT